MSFEVHHHHFFHHGEDTDVLAKLDRLETKIMSAFDDLSAQVKALTDYVTNTLPQKIAELRAGGNGATDAQLQALSAEVQSDLSAIQADFATPAPSGGATTPKAT